LKGKHTETIIVGANYDLGPPDNWKGASLLPYLYKALSHRKRHYTFVFVAFADEQRKLSGSSFFVQQMTDAQAGETEAMVNLDVLGFSFTKISEQHSDPQLVKLMINAAYMFKLTASQVDLARAIQTDSEPFAARGIPRITLHSLTVGTLEELKENEQAPLGRFRPDNYYDSYRLIAGYLAYLDETLKPRRHKK
jgi:Zn-dependent M28 family amino/carboxypeptidase